MKIIFLFVLMIFASDVALAQDDMNKMPGMQKTQIKNNKSRQVSKVIYTCVMHPEVQMDKPGKCPKCGKSLSLKEQFKAEIAKQYTCPMHPDVTGDKAGKCPKCGMDLVEIKIKN